MRNLFWDSCVFNAFLYDEKHIYDVDSIVQYLDEARQRQFRIYTSSIILTEIAASKIKARGVGSGMDFINDLMGACVVIDASVNILNLAGQLRDLPYRKHQSGKRKLTTGDAIMLASALHLEEALWRTAQCLSYLRRWWDKGGGALAQLSRMVRGVFRGAVDAGTAGD